MICQEHRRFLWNDTTMFYCLVAQHVVSMIEPSTTAMHGALKRFHAPTERRGPNVCLADEPVKTSSSYKNKTPSLWLELISMSLKGSHF